MNRIVERRLLAGDGDGIVRVPGPVLVGPLIAHDLVRYGLLKEDLDYHVLRAAMVIIFFFFGYQKWWPYEAQRLDPYISHGPLIFWLYPAFDPLRQPGFSAGVEWTIGTLLMFGFRKDIGRARCARIVHDFCRHGHDHPIHAGRLGRLAAARVPGCDFKQRSLADADVALLAVSFYLLKQDVQRVVRSQPS